VPTRDEDVPVDDEQPDPDAPPTPSAPGSEGMRSSPDHGQGQFQEAYDSVPDEVAASGSIAHDDDDDEAEDTTER
jgi:hypothetical protein